MKKFNPRTCRMCELSFIPTGSIQKICKYCTVKYRNQYKRNWANKNKERDKANRKKWYWNNLTKVREAKRSWNNTKGVAYRKIWYAENKEVVNQRLRDKYWEKTKSRVEANRIVKKLGWKRICSECGSIIKINIHHKDLNPFNNMVKNLIFLCRVCHTNLHVHIRMVADQNRVLL